AMCYSYSGQCLFSSILGVRSGNRGRCAQPCRLSYQISDAEGNAKGDSGYVLSLKDMCTLAFLPKLIEAGIDSFKIEGRMKRPEYAAGVTAVYRKYIDSYYKNPDAYHVEQADMDKLRKLYIRDEVQTGYYERSNGREMITVRKPGYLKTDEALLSEIAKNYLDGERKRSAAFSA
ncbi:MAG: U32 family peptidase, partial [Lachnospiraceae bacterium]|nr:U32 family peptidase [Lachnospiraceae bacterium]